MVAEMSVCSLLIISLNGKLGLGCQRILYKVLEIFSHGAKPEFVISLKC